jgi:hypothetical protein
MFEIGAIASEGATTVSSPFTTGNAPSGWTGLDLETS